MRINYELHIGHYKAVLQQPDIHNVHRTMLLIPSKQEWFQSVGEERFKLCSKKEPESPWIHRLRIIELFDAQANAGFQIFIGCKMIRNTVDQNLLQEESYGSTQGKMAASVLLRKYWY